MPVLPSLTGFYMRATLAFNGLKMFITSYLSYITIKNFYNFQHNSFLSKFTALTNAYTEGKRKFIKALKRS